MLIDLFKHWMPDLRQTLNKNVYVAEQCPFCPYSYSKNSFRINLKIKVFKCYNCGRSGKDFNKFKHYLKLRDKYGLNHFRFVYKIKGRQSKDISPIEVHYGCETYRESQLPF